MNVFIISFSFMESPKIINFTTHGDKRGKLTPIEQFKDVPFDIKRLFYITNVDNFPRGFHGHRDCDQVIIAINGNLKVEITNNDNKNEIFVLNDNCKGLYFPKHHWLKMFDFSSDCIILVLCSHYYDENEYIRNFGDFLEYTNSHNKEKIQFFSLNENTKLIRKEVDLKINEIISKSAFVLGEDLVEFEKNFAKYNNVGYSVGVSDGTSALICALKSLELNPLDEIIVQSNSYIAAPIAVDYCNLKLKIVDVDESLNLDLNQLEKNLTSKTKVVIIVHLYGNCCDMDKLIELKNKYGFYLIEDAAQAHGSEYKGKKLGSFGDLGCFSFYPSKNLGSFGEGGSVITNNEDLYLKVKKIRNYGSIEKYVWEIKGSNERMHNIQAGILNIKLKYLDEWNKKRNNIANYYNNELSKIKEIKIPLKYTSFCNYHLYVILIERRQELIHHLKNNDIPYSIHYPETFYKSKAYLNYNHLDFYADVVKERILSLPMYPEMPLNSAIKIVNIIKEFYDGR